MHVKARIPGIHITENQQNLARILSNLIGIATKRSTIAQLSHVKIDVQQEFVQFTTTDMEVSITERVTSGNIQRCGVITVDAIKLYEIIKKMPSQSNVEIITVNNSIIISSEKIEFSLPFLDAESFPSISEEEKQCEVEFSKDEIITLFEKVKFATSSESTRQNLNGIYIEATSGIITAAATDIHRLAVVEITKQTSQDFSFIIPKKTINEVIKVASKCENIKLSLHGDQYITRIKFAFEGIEVISKLIAGTFIDFRNVIPHHFNFSLTLNRAQVAKSIERVAIVSSQQSKAIKFGIRKNEIHLDATSPDSSFGHDVIDLETPQEESLEIYFNYIYLLDVLSVIEGELVLMLFNESHSKVVFQDVKNKSATYVVMPLCM